MTTTPGMFSVGTAACAPGERAFGHRVSAYLEDASEVRVPVILLNGAQDGPTLWIGAAMHGIEIAGAEVIRRLAREQIDPQRPRGRVIALPIQNPLAMRDHSLITPKDGQNINRLFPGGPADSISGRMAEVLFKESVLRADYVVDIHCNTPPTLCWVTLHTHDGDPVGDRAAAMAEAFGITIIQPGPGATWGQLGGARGMLCDMAAERGKPGVIVELQAWTLEEPPVRAGVRGLMNVMKHLGMIEGALEQQTDVPIIRERLAKIRPLRATHGGFVHHLRKVGERVAQGDPLAAILDPFGDEVERLTSPGDGYVVTYPHMLGNQAAATGELLAFVAPPK